MKIYDITQKTVLADKVFLADSFWSRMRGLIGRESLAFGEAMIITQCNSIHMFFMRFAIDVVFTDKDLRVVGLVESIKPFFLSRIFWTASKAIELPAGTIKRFSVEIGHHLQLS